MIIDNIFWFISGAILVIVIWLMKAAYSNFRFKKEYILPELNKIVHDIHDNLKEANKSCIKLTDAFIEIEKQNAN